ncbi:MAG: DNA-binding protein [Flavobacterium sp.]|nr:MAG: DNA-binding protein [Flavobacterium sp.]
MEKNIILSPICFRDLVAEIASEVTGRIYRDLNLSQIITHNSEPEERLTRTQLADYLGVTLPTVDRYRNRSVFPYYQTGRTIYFKKSEVDNALSVGKKKGFKNG